MVSRLSSAASTAHWSRSSFGAVRAAVDIPILRVTRDVIRSTRRVLTARFNLLIVAALSRVFC